jgi:hypothetical protein
MYPCFLGDIPQPNAVHGAQRSDHWSDRVRPKARYPQLLLGTAALTGELRDETLCAIDCGAAYWLAKFTRFTA